jgi:hypothetical protein
LCFNDFTGIYIGVDYYAISALDNMYPLDLKIQDLQENEVKPRLRKLLEVTQLTNGRSELKPSCLSPKPISPSCHTVYSVKEVCLLPPL